MIERFYLIFEILAVLLCLHGLYGEKFKWNIYTISFIGIEFVAYQAEEAFGHNIILKAIFYILIFTYSIIQFRKPFKISVLNYVLCMVISAVLQMICYFPVMVWYDVLSGKINFVVNILLICIVFILYQVKILQKISEYMQQKGKIVGAFLIFSVVFILGTMFKLNIYQRLEIMDYIVLVIGGILLFSLLLLLQKEKLLNRQMEAESDLNKLYSGALMELIDNVRSIQHNYKNQFAAMQGMIYTANSLEELKIEYEQQYNSMKRDDVYAQVLSGSDDHVITGFLYSKLCNIDLDKIQVNYFLKINKIKNSFLVVDLIKILGVLIDNALEEVIKYDNKIIDIKIYDDKGINIEVGNICRYISKAEINNFFKKGNSSKGKDRGYGLYTVKCNVKKWKGEIIPDNVNIKGNNWFYIKIQIPDEE